MRIPPFAKLALLFAGAAACAPPNAAKPYPSAEPPAGAAAPEAAASQVRYFDRVVDLEPFLVGFPYTQWMPSLRTDRLFFLKKGERYQLQMLDLSEGAPQGAAHAVTISDVDWSQRSLWRVHHHAGADTLWLHADERNDEHMNLWTLDLKTGSLAQVTDHDYVYGFGFDEAETQVAYLPRAGAAPPYRTCLRVLDVASEAAREVVCDTPALQFTWSNLRFSPDGREVYFSAQVDGDRNRVQLVAVDLNAARPALRVITDARVGRTDVALLERWLDADTGLFIANDDGFGNLFSLSLKTGSVRQLTHFTEDLTSAELTDVGVVGVHRSPLGSTLAVIDPRTGKVTAARALPGAADVRDGRDGRVVWSHEAPDQHFELNINDVRSDAQGPAIGAGWSIGLPDAVRAAVVQCQARRVEIPTFDRDRDGQPRQLHAFVLSPLRPPADPGRRLALIEAFYGGDNAYSSFAHVMCAAGLTVVSPTVRGGDGFGKEFAALNDRDLGGDEIVDLFHVARWTERELDLKPAQIGVFGGSHGGYATMRALTFPSGFKGESEPYPFGFGLAHAGFSDIKSFHDQCNIPDWVVLESGDPSQPADLERMRDRSPLSHVDLLAAPLLLTHGSSDWRVPVGESRAFFTKAQALGKPVTFVEFEGQGHHIEGITRLAELYQARFDLLERVASAAVAP